MTCPICSERVGRWDYFVSYRGYRIHTACFSVENIEKAMARGPVIPASRLRRAAWRQERRAQRKSASQLSSDASSIGKQEESACDSLESKARPNVSDLYRVG
jgi:hypothetical protein